MSPKERLEYDEHVNAILIQNDVLDSAKLEGKIEGKIEGMHEAARNMKKLNLPTEIIMQTTGLSADEINNL